MINPEIQKKIIFWLFYKYYLISSNLFASSWIGCVVWLVTDAAIKIDTLFQPLIFCPKILF